MISIKISENEQKISHIGNPDELGIEIGMAVAAIYNAIKTTSEPAADLFKKTVQTVMEDGSPAWGPINQMTIILPIEKGGA